MRVQTRGSAKMTMQPAVRERRREPRPATLPPVGATPAGDLQRQIADAALRDFYAPKAAPGSRTGKRIVSVLLICAASWSAVFGLGAVLVG